MLIQFKLRVCKSGVFAYLFDKYNNDLNQKNYTLE